MVLIERGHEVGGGDQRVDTGTVARLVEAEQAPDGRWLALFAGTERFRVVEWLPDDPYPQAQVEELPEPEWDPADDAVLAAAEDAGPRGGGPGGRAGRGGRPRPASSSPTTRPGGPGSSARRRPSARFDRQRLLEAPRAVRLVTLVQQAAEARQTLAFRLGGG